MSHGRGPVDGTCENCGAIVWSPATAELFRQLAENYDQDDYPAARECIRRLREIVPDDPEIVYYDGIMPPDEA